MGGCGLSSKRLSIILSFNLNSKLRAFAIIAAAAIEASDVAALAAALVAVLAAALVAVAVLVAVLVAGGSLG